MSKISLKIIAQELGVSTATVSLVLSEKNKNGRVSKELSNRILEKAKELNYIPNSLAKSLRVGSSKTLGLIIADISNVFFGSLAFYIQEYAELKGYTVIIGNTNEKVSKMKSMVDILTRRQVDGFIITPTEGSEEIIKDLVEKRFPMVLVDRCFPGISSSNVLINNYDISFKAVNSLIIKGCRRVGLIIYKQNQFHMQERKRGYVDALKSIGIYDINLVKEVRYEQLEEDVRQATSDFLNMDEKIDGIFFATNSISMMGLRSLIYFTKNDLKGIQIMCFDESDAYCLLPFDIPFVRQPIEEMGKISVNLVTEQINNSAIKNMQYLLSAQLIEKEYV